MKKENKGWAINTSRHGMIGKYWWFYGGAPSIPTSMEGYEVAVFRTKREAVYARSAMLATNPTAKVVRVAVTVEIL